MPQVLPAQKKKIVEFPLLPPRGFLPVNTQLLVANALQRLPSQSRPLKCHALLIAELLQLPKLRFEFTPMPQQLTIALQLKLQFRRAKPRSQIARPDRMELPPPRIQMIHKVLYPRHLLIRRTQSQLLLMFNALPKMQNRLQRKTKCHTCTLRGDLQNSCHSELARQRG
jgi:hypothetical protein